MTSLAHLLTTVSDALATLAGAAALPLLITLGLRGWVRRDPSPVQAPRSAHGLAGADLRAPLPGSGRARNDHDLVVLARPPRQIRRGGRATTEAGAGAAGATTSRLRS